MDELSAKRALKHQDSRMWSCEDALESALDDVRSGKDSPSMVVIHFVERGADGSWIHWYSAAGVTVPEHFAILALAKDKLMDWWRGRE